MPTITHAEAIARAKKVGEVCKANAVATEKLRHLPPENVQAMVEVRSDRPHHPEGSRRLRHR